MTNYWKYFCGLFMASTVILIIATYLMGKEIRDCKKVSLSDTTIVYLPGDTIFKTIFKQINKPDTIRVTKPLFVDTLSILEDYYLAKIYTDTLSDSILEAIIRDSITMNSLAGRHFKYRIINEKQVTITNTIIKENTGLYVGAILEGSKNSFGFGPSITYITKKPMSVGIGYDLLNKNAYLQVQWKLFDK
jgi:hypothetical protein